jgi:protein O-mannosyl-transferase
VTDRRRGWAPLDLGALVGLALVSSVSGLGNRFTFDDEPIIMANPHIHDLGALARVWTASYWPPELGGRLYRPLTMVAFTTEWWAGHGSPFLFHAVNIVLYAAVAVAVYVLALRCLPRWAAWLAAALFAVHPVHVEVVGNAVGQAELLAALATIAATAWYVGIRSRGRFGVAEIVGLTALYVAGCLTKEHAIVLPLLLVAAELTIIATPRDWRALWSLAAAAVAYIGVRAIVLHGMVGEIPAVEFRDTSIATRWWTMLGVGGQWLRLLVWPAHLAAIYSPPAVPVLAQPTLASVLVLVCALVLAAVAFRGPPVVAFGLAWAGICLLPTSNVLVPTGVFLAERTLFLPSIGLVLAAGAAATIIPSGALVTRALATAAAAILIFLGAWRSTTRQPVWHDDARFLAQAVADEPFSYAAHYQWARMLLASGQQEAGVREAERAEQLWDGDPELAGVLGRAYARMGRCGDAVPLLRQTVAELPSRPFPRERLVRCLVQLGDTVEAGRIARDGRLQ